MLLRDLLAELLKLILHQGLANPLVTQSDLLGEILQLFHFSPIEIGSYCV